MSVRAEAFFGQAFLGRPLLDNMTDADALAKSRRIEAICDDAFTDARGLKQVADMLEDELKDQGLLTIKVVPPRLTGFSSRNRGQYGGCPGQALGLIDDILKAGFSVKEMANATFEEVKPGSTDIQTFNEELANGDPSSAPVTETIRYASIACGHTYAGFRAFQASVPHLNELCSKDGRLSIEKLGERDPLYAKCAREGVLAKVPGARLGHSEGRTNRGPLAPPLVPASASASAPASAWTRACKIGVGGTL